MAAETRERTIVLAGNYRLVEAWCRARSLSPRSVVYISNPRQLMGLTPHPENVVLVDGFFLNRGANAIWDALAHALRRRGGRVEDCRHEPVYPETKG